MKWLYMDRTRICICAFLSLSLLLFPHMRSITVESIVQFEPQSIIMAVLIFIVIYTLKTFVMLPPVTVLYIAAGIVFPGGWGVVVTCLCLVITLTGGYVIGKILGRERVCKIISKNKKIAEFLDEERHYSLPMLCFTARVLPIPFDLLSMFCGAINVPYGKYIVASLLGLLPVMLPTVLAFGTAENSLSTGFIIPLSMSVISSAISIILYKRQTGKRKQANDQSLPCVGFYGL